MIRPFSYILVPIRWGNIKRQSNIFLYHTGDLFVKYFTNGGAAKSHNFTQLNA